MTLVLIISPGIIPRTISLHYKINFIKLTKNSAFLNSGQPWSLQVGRLPSDTTNSNMYVKTSLYWVILEFLGIDFWEFKKKVKSITWQNYFWGISYIVIPPVYLWVIVIMMNHDGPRITVPVGSSSDRVFRVLEIYL